MGLVKKEILTYTKNGAVVKHLTRFTLLRTPWGRLALHVFHADDGDRHPHDHPWDFWSFILWGGYYDMIPNDHLGGTVLGTMRSFRKAFTVAHRPAEFTHRVELPFGKGPVVTLVWTSLPRRAWGFYTEIGWIDMKTYYQNLGEALPENEKVL